MEKKFKISQILTLKSSLDDFYFSGRNSVITFFNENKIHPIRARVRSYDRSYSEKKCYEIEVEWIDQKDKRIQQLSSYGMLESEFEEFDQASSELKAGDWAYYKGGADTDYWKKGMVGKISSVSPNYYRFEEGCGTLNHGGSNRKVAFRPATQDEIDAACGRITSIKGSHSHSDSIVSTGTTRPDSVSNSKNPETKVSFKSTQLVANKINTSKKIKNFLLIS